MKEQLNPQVQLIRQRVQHLYQRGGGLTQQNEVLAAAFVELEFALEQLQQIENEQRRRHEEWLNSQAELEVESQYYQHLFMHAPAGYLVTSLDGTIRKANPIAAELLECTERNLIGRSIAMFVPEGQRREFRTRIAELARATRPKEWSLTMQSWDQTVFEAGLSVMAVSGRANDRPLALHWLMRGIGAQNQPRRRDNDGHQQPAAADTPADTSNQVALARQRFMFLAKASVQLMIAQDLDGMLGHLAHLAVPELADACIIDLANPETEQIQRLVVAREAHSDASVHTWRGSFVPEDHTPHKRNGRAHAAQAMHIPADDADITNRVELRALFETLDPSSAIVAPIQAGERPIGSVALVMNQSKRQYTSIDAALVEELARQVSLAIARLRH